MERPFQRHPIAAARTIARSDWAATQAAKVELYRQFQASGLRKIDLASRIGISKTVVDRLFDLGHQTRMSQMETAFEALGKRIEIVVENAA